MLAWEQLLPGAQPAHSTHPPTHLPQAMFLGRLNPSETGRLSERLIKFVVFKVVFCGALIIPDVYEIVLWLAW